MSPTARERFLSDVYVGVLHVAAAAGTIATPIWYRYEPGSSVGDAVDDAHVFAMRPERWFSADLTDEFASLGLPAPASSDPSKGHP